MTGRRDVQRKRKLARRARGRLYRRLARLTLFWRSRPILTFPGLEGLEPIEVPSAERAVWVDGQGYVRQ